VLGALLFMTVLAGCGGEGGSDEGDGTTTSEPPADDGGESGASEVTVLALGEETVLADLLALDIRPVASSANVVVDGGFVGLDELDTEGIDALVSSDPNIERLAAYEPDVVVTNEFVVGFLGQEVLDGLADEVVVVPYDPAEQMRAIGEAFGKGEEAEALLERLDTAISDGSEAVAELSEDRRTVSVATIYPGTSVAAWVDGPIDVPDTLLKLGFTLDPASGDVTGAENGRVYLSEEQIGILDAPIIVAMQSEYVDGEAEAVAAMAEDPLWTGLRAVSADQVVTVERLGYPGVAGRIRLVEELLARLVEG
jgi:iron complex transport system substrate-binding protein